MQSEPIPPARCHGARTYSVAQYTRDALWLARHSVQIGRIWFGGRVDPEMREKAMLAVARANGCRFCTCAHSQWALAVGVRDAELAALEGMNEEDFDRDTWSVIAHARDRAMAEFHPTQGCGYASALVERHGEQLLDDIECVARVMTFANRTMNTFDALICRWRGTPLEHSRLSDELVLSAMGVPGLGVVITMLAVRRRTGPRAMWRNLQRVTRSLDSQATG